MIEEKTKINATEVQEKFLEWEILSKSCPMFNKWKSLKF